MEKRIKYFIFVSIIFIFLILICTSYFKFDNSISTVKFKTDSNEITFYCSIADTEFLRIQGLNNVEFLEDNEGMLFIYENEVERYFTMKDMKIPLDIIFINSNLSIINIDEAEIGEVHIPSMGPAQYVVEINKGLASKHGIKEGDKVDIIYDI